MKRGGPYRRRFRRWTRGPAASDSDTLRNLTTLDSASERGMTFNRLFLNRYKSVAPTRARELKRLCCVLGAGQARAPRPGAGRSPSHPPPPSPNGAQKHKPERQCTAPALYCLFRLRLSLHPRTGTSGRSLRSSSAFAASAVRNFSSRQLLGLKHWTRHGSPRKASRRARRSSRVCSAGT